MTEEIVVYLKDMETYLEPEEYQAFLKAKQEVDEYNKRMDEYETNKAVNERLRDECRKQRDEAKNDVMRTLWEAEAMVSNMKATMPAPYKPNYYFVEHDHFIELVRERKIEEEKRKERAEKRKGALQSIAPPLNDAKEYLSDDEYERFLDSLPGAADAYLDSEEGRQVIPNVWLLNERASDYLWLTGIIKERKQKKARRKQAQLEHDQFLRQINDAKKKCKQDLAKEKKPSFTYPPALAKYHPGGWCELERPTKQEVEKWARQYIWERVPPAVRDFVSWDLSWQVQTLPSAKYEVLGVPCLTWCFRTLILVEVHLKLAETKFTREFHGYEYPMKVEAENLGFIYLGPVEWDRQEGFTTPIALLSMLVNGKLEDDGIEIMEHEGSSISFFIRGYDEAFTEIDERFRQFIMDVTKDKTLPQGLLVKGLIDKVTAQLVEEKAKLPLPHPVGAQASLGESIVDNSDVEAALEVLGYKKKEIKPAMEAAPLSPGMSIEEKVGAVLKILGGNFP